MKSIFTGIAVLPVALLTAPTHADTSVLTPQPPIEVPGPAGHFDFMNFDPGMHRVLACHPGAKNLVVLDVKSGKVTTIDTGKVNGCAVDTADNRYYTAGGNHDVVVIDRQTLAKIGDIPTPGPCDDVVYEPKDGRVYVCNDDGTQDWVVDPKTNTIAGSVTIAGAPEVVKYDPKTDKLYQNIKPADEIQVIDPSSNTVVATWSTAPADSPHGLALDIKKGRVFSAGRNGKVVAIDVKSGKTIASCDIAKGVDEIAYDPSTNLLYCHCDGAMSIVRSTKKGLRKVADVSISANSKNVAVDPETQSVWIAYPDANGSFIQEYRRAQVAGK